MTTPEDLDPLLVQREAAMFYGLFLRGHSADKLRKDIDVPLPTVERWLSRPHYEGDFRENAKRVYQFRKKVLAVFEELVGRARLSARLQ